MWKCHRVRARSSQFGEVDSFPRVAGELARRIPFQQTASKLAGYTGNRQAIQHLLLR